MLYRINLPSKKTFINKHWLYEPVLIILIKIILSEEAGLCYVTGDPHISVAYRYRHFSFTPHGHCKSTTALFHVTFISSPSLPEAASFCNTVSLKAEGKEKERTTSWILKLLFGRDTHHFCSQFFVQHQKHGQAWHIGRKKYNLSPGNWQGVFLNRNVIYPRATIVLEYTTSIIWSTKPSASLCAEECKQ